ncbi:MAG: ral secretion pathway protein [Myxococcaceae bacterium]|nr:ral secretion pathway protein [Myxococcaceae bacterium]
MSVFQRLASPKKQLAGFTLLEVMIAVVILAVGLSSLFTSEAGAIRIAQRARTTTVATLLARCKMAEVEEKIYKEGWPGELIEGNDECCEDAAHEGFKCEWKVERIKLPDQEEDKDADEALSGSDGTSKKSKKSGGNGMLDALSGLSKQEPGDKMSSITDFLSGGGANLTGSEKRKSEREADGRNPDDKDRPKSDDISGSELDPMASMVMGLAFPMLKPVIEEGTRRASVKVIWKEGAKEQTFEVVQFMVSEQQIILPDIDDDDGGVANPAQNSAGGATKTTGTSGTSNTGTSIRGNP